MLLEVPLSRPESFEPVVNDSGRACGFIVAVLHFSAPTSSVPVVLEGICVNFLCHVQGQAAQGQLIAFIIMISRQIYRACLKSADQSFGKCVYSSQFGSFSSLICIFTPVCSFCFINLYWSPYLVTMYVMPVTCTVFRM